MDLAAMTDHLYGSFSVRSFCEYRLTEEADERCAEVNAEEVPQLGLLGCVRVKCDGRPTSKVRI
jgi:hypothetical protein